jgi:hypothetical protein
MSAVGLKKLILKDRLHTTSIESFLLRYYEQIISGVWGLMLLRPIESGIYWLAGDKNAAKFFSKRFLIIFIVYTIFFLLSSILIPEIRKIRLRRQLNKMIKNNTPQKQKLKNIISANILCQSFFTKLGFAQILMIAIVNTVFVAFCFSTEYFIDFINTHDRPLFLLLSFIGFAIILIIVSWFVDAYIAKIMEKKQSQKIIIKNDSGKDLMMQVMQLIARDTLENKSGQALMSSCLEDIYELMYLSNEEKINNHE